MILHRVWTLNPCDKIPDSFLNLEIIFISKCCHEFWDLVQSASFMTLSKKGTSYLPRSRSTGRWYCESQRCRCSRWSGLNVHCEHHNRVGNQRFKFSVTRFDENSRICLIFFKNNNEPNPASFCLFNWWFFFLWRSHLLCWLVLVPQNGEFVVPVGLVATKVSTQDPAEVVDSWVTKLLKSSLNIIQEWSFPGQEQLSTTYNVLGYTQNLKV